MLVFKKSPGRVDFSCRAVRTGRSGKLARAMICAALIWAASSLAFPAAAQSLKTDQAEIQETEAEHVTAPVIVEGRELFRVRGLSALPAEKRAQNIAGRIEELAADRSIPIKDLGLVETGRTTRIMARDRLVMAINQADIKVEGVDTRTLSEMYLESTKSAIERYRYERTPRFLLRSSLRALGATALLAVILFVVIRTSRRLELVLERRYKAKIRDTHIQIFHIVEVEKLWTGLRAALHAIRGIAMAVVCLFYANYVGSCYPWTRPLAERGFMLLLEPMRTIASAILASIPNLLFVAVVFIVLRYLLKLVHIFFTALHHGTVSISAFDPDWALPTYKILRALTVAFGVVVAYPYIPGAQSEAFKGISIFVGIVFSLGSSSAVSNIIAGYLITYRRAFKVGDRIQVMDLIGDVVEIRLQATYLRSVKNEELIVPNSQIINSNVINYSSLSKTRGLILHTTVGIGYETPWRKVESMLLMAAERTPGLLREPPPFVLQKQLGDFCVTYEINVYCDRPQEGMLLYSVLHRNILDVFNEYGVQIMVPAYEGDPEVAKIVPKEKWFEAPAKMYQAAEGSTQARKPESHGASALDPG